jgi:WD40 repeat protein
VIWAIAFSPDGGLMASGDSNSTALLWDTVEGRELRRFPGTLPFRSADFSPDGRRLALAADDKGTNSLSLWDSARPDKVQALAGHQGRVSCVRFSSDGLLLASGGAGVHLWDVSSGRIIKSLKPGWLEPKVEACSLAFSPDGRSIAIGDLHPSLWDVATGKEIRKFVSFGSIERFRTTFVGFTPDGQSIVEARGNGKIRLWDVAGGREKACLADPPKQGGVAQGLQCGALSKDGTRLAVSNFSDAPERRGSVTLWNLLSGRPEATIAVSEACSALAFTPDGQWLAVADFTEEDGGQIKLHRISELI